MLPKDAKLISVDDHLIEHPDVWRDRLPGRWRDEGPTIVETTEGYELWRFEGEIHPQVVFGAVAGTDPRTWRPGVPVRYDEMRAGFYDPKARLADMDEAGIHAQLCFPTFPGFAGKRFLQARDKALAHACVVAYNDFLLDEWCVADPDRLLPLCILPLWDVSLSVGELDRVADRGAKAISFLENPAPMGLPSFHTDHWDPLLDRMEALDLPLCLHFGTSGAKPVMSPDAPHPVEVALVGTNSMFTLADILFSPMLHRHPDLKIVLSEGGVGWIPYVLERIDYAWTNHRFHANVDQDVRPSELFRRNVWGCFIDDATGIDLRERIGIDRMLWESDYPHADTTWPRCRERAEQLLADVDPDDARRIVELNARAVFNL